MHSPPGPAPIIAIRRSRFGEFGLVIDGAPLGAGERTLRIRRPVFDKLAAVSLSNETGFRDGHATDARSGALAQSGEYRT